MSDSSDHSFPKHLATIAALLAAILTGLCTLAAACVGLGQPAVQWFMDWYVQPLPTATLPPPTNAVKLPASESEALSVAVKPGPLWYYVGRITQDMNRSVVTQTVSADSISFPGDFSPRFSRANSVSTVQVIVTGRSAHNPVQMSNRIPIRLVSYRPISQAVDLAAMEIGGGMDVWLVAADISKQVLSYPDQVVWAEYTADLRERLIQSQEECPSCFEHMPSEIEKTIVQGTEPVPDYFTLDEDEMLVLSAAMVFREPGIYLIRLGVEYVFKGHSCIAWADPPLQVYVPHDYYLWHPWVSEQYFLSEICQLQPTGDYSCTEKCKMVPGGLECK